MLPEITDITGTDCWRWRVPLLPCILLFVSLLEDTVTFVTSNGTMSCILFFILAMNAITKCNS